jgi:diphthine-ammonia ligase
MKLGVLFSGGKDSCLALSKAAEENDVVCLITIISKNSESYMFHTPNIRITSLQAQAIGLPQVKVETEGKKEEELSDLRNAIQKAKSDFGIEGVVTGAIDSVYQAERVQRICDELDLWCFNPLWKRDQIELLKEIVESDYDVIISGVFAYPLSQKWLGRHLDMNAIGELAGMMREHQISPSGEGGEIETTVLDAPFFDRRIRIFDSVVNYKENSGTFAIKHAELVGK